MTSAEHLAPRTATEVTIAEIWSEVLGVSDISVSDRFSALGGHSLFALQVLWRLQEQFEIELSLRSVFEAATLADLAMIVEQATTKGNNFSDIAKVAGKGDLPLSSQQQQLLFFNELAPGHPFYNVSHGLQIDGELNIDVLRRAIAALVHRHEILRTRFELRQGKPHQFIEPSPPIALPEVDLRDFSIDPTTLRRVVIEETRAAFNLAAGPPYRFLLIFLPESRHLLLITMHHIAVDGWSVQILLQDLATFYKAVLAGEPPVLPNLPVDYVDYSAWQQQFLGSNTFRDQFEYWRRQLAGVPKSLDLTISNARPKVPGYSGGVHRVLVPGDLTGKLRELGERHSTTMFMTMLAGFNVLLSRYSETDDIPIGVPVSGRMHKEVENVVGPFVNTLVFRTDLRDDPSFNELLDRTRETALGAYAHQDVPFEHLVRNLEPIRSLSHNPLVQVLFWVLPERTNVSIWDWGDLSVRTLRPDGPQFHQGADGSTGTIHLDLEVLVRERGEELECGIRYREDLFSLEVIEGFGMEFVRLLEDVADRPHLPLSIVSTVDRPEGLDSAHPELARIEQALLGMAEIDKVAVVVLRSSIGERVVVAYITTVCQQGLPDINDLRATLRRTIPESEFPSTFVWLPELPITSLGEVDERSLPAPSSTLDFMDSHPPLGSQFEAALANIWANLLEVDHVNPDDNFFDLGGHSILSIEMIWRIGQEFGVQLPISVVFEAATLRQLAQEISRAVSQL